MEKFGILIDENRQKYIQIFKGLSMLVRNMWPSGDHESMVLGTQFFIFGVIFDDLIDTNEPEFGMKLINRAINIFKLGKLEEDATPLERIAFDLNESLEYRVGDQHPLMNLCRNAFIDYFDNLIPWQNIKKLEGDMSMNLYYNMRIHNIGMIPAFSLSAVFIMKRLHSDILLDPLWKSLMYHSGNICALYNDVFSYEKELREKDERMNSFHFMKTQNNWSDQECLDFMDKEFDICFEQYFIHENLIKQKFIPILKFKEDQEEFIEFVDHFHTMISKTIEINKFLITNLLLLKYSTDNQMNQYDPIEMVYQKMEKLGLLNNETRE
ncbi:hypothetical protein PPL_10493 [Heterostelium album PN500]|uniref:Terpene synthase n=1 Tax=Heterostelium pallidum (strain ATCC 26659 / Pp 5 / PN500) TaxID=670386 RepID=D3BR89_HETP5|nr:hypothetical protein PPL_10493 [Heterostelium album PN500]EFA75921.1 hypothetical protein PPL_10493 [Heterostelium album PN500]|eukprot:XP_020428055.1 hypothetical protein PPL_10493 [Heterostelium album PN500]